jgi:hypothetical protein
MSARNGDKARFGRERQRKLLRRKRARGLRKAMETRGPSPASAGSEDAPTLSH